MAKIFAEFSITAQLQKSKGEKQKNAIYFSAGKMTSIPTFWGLIPHLS